MHKINASVWNMCSKKGSGSVPQPVTFPAPWPPAPGLRAPAAAGGGASGGRGGSGGGAGPARVPAGEAHAGPQPDHGGAAEVPPVPHRRQAVGRLRLRLGPEKEEVGEGGEEYCT